MIEALAIVLVSQMKDEKLIDDRYEEQYIYAFISLVERLITVGSIVLLSLLFKIFIPTVFFLIFFLGLRKRTGGYHFKYFYQCYLATIITYFIIIVIDAVIVNHPKLLLGFLLLSVCIIEFIGTINHPNLNMNSEELTESKRSARFLVLLEGSVICCFEILKVNMLLVSYMVIAVILCAFLLLLAKILKQEVN